MNKETFLSLLSSLINDLPDNECVTILDFYREIIEDKVENGISEAAAVAELGDVYQLAQKILQENPNRKPHKTNRTGIIVLCSVLGLFLLLGAVAAIVNTTMYYSKGNSSSLQGNIVVNGKTVTDTNNKSKTYTAKVADIKQIKLQAENKAIHIIPTDSDEIKIHYVSNSNQTYRFSNDGGVVSVDNTDNHSSFSLFDFHFNSDDDDYTITVEVPVQYGNDLSIRTTNSEITVTKLEKLHDIICETTNSAINLSDIHANSASIDTKNAVITLRNVNTQESLEALTKNAKISLDNIASPDINLKTENGIIGGTIAGRAEDYTIDSSTTNGINNLNNRSGGSKKLTVTTTNALISVSFINS